MIILNKNYITHEYLYSIILYFIMFSAKYTCDIDKIVQYKEQISPKTLCY